jgi:hypothetical protein
MEIQIFHHAKILSSKKKNPLKKNQNPSRYHNSITNLKFHHKPKYHLLKILKTLPTGQNPLSYYIYSIMNLNTISLRALVAKANKVVSIIYVGGLFSCVEAL